VVLVGAAAADDVAAARLALTCNLNCIPHPICAAGVLPARPARCAQRPPAGAFGGRGGGACHLPRRFWL